MLAFLQTIDVSALNALRSMIDPTSAWQISLVRALVDLEVFLTVLVLVGLWIFGNFFEGNKGENSKREALALFYVVISSFGIYWILNLWLPARPRPETVSVIQPLIQHLPDNSFPSGHAIFAGASMLGAFILLRRKWIFWMLFSTGILTCLARVLAGVHYPGDILIGYFFGILLAYFLSKIVLHPKCARSKLFSFPIKIAAFFRL